MGKIRAVAMGDEKQEKEQKRRAEARRQTKDSKKPFGNAQGKSSGQISNKELKKAKEFLKGHLVLEIEDSRSVAGFYGLAEILEKKIITPNEYIEKINKVTKKEVIDVARRYLKKETLNLAVIGNFSDGQRFEKLLKL